MLDQACAHLGISCSGECVLISARIRRLQGLRCCA